MLAELVRGAGSPLQTTVPPEATVDKDPVMVARTESCPRCGLGPARKGLRGDEQALYWHAIDALRQPEWLWRDLIALSIVRAIRLSRWEADDGRLTPHATQALDQVRRFIARYEAWQRRNRKAREP